MAVADRMALSTREELRLPLRWVAILHGRVQASLALTTGVHEAEDVIKALLAGADVAMSAAALIRHGPGKLTGDAGRDRALARGERVRVDRAAEGLDEPAVVPRSEPPSSAATTCARSRASPRAVRRAPQAGQGSSRWREPSTLWMLSLVRWASVTGSREPTRRPGRSRAARSARGSLTLEPDALMLHGTSSEGRHVVRRVAYADLVGVRIGRDLDERLSGDPTLLLERRTGGLLRVSLLGPGLLWELADLLALVVGESSEHLERVVVVARLKEGMRERLRALIADGPPFDPGGERTPAARGAARRRHGDLSSRRSSDTRSRAGARAAAASLEGGARLGRLPDRKPAAGLRRLFVDARGQSGRRLSRGAAAAGTILRRPASRSRPADDTRGSTSTIVFARRGGHRLVVRNVQTPAGVGLQTLGRATCSGRRSSSAGAGLTHSDYGLPLSAFRAESDAAPGERNQHGAEPSRPLHDPKGVPVTNAENPTGGDCGAGRRGGRGRIRARRPDQGRRASRPATRGTQPRR